MQRVLVLVLLTSAFVGCIGGDDADLDPQSGALDAGSSEDVVRFDADGQRLPIPDAEEVGQPVYNLTGFGGAEPTMGITESGALFAAAGNDLIRSTDDGASWESVNDIVMNSDPLMYVDDITDTVYFDPMFPTLLCTALESSTDDGDSWTQHPPACHPPPMDHQKFFTGQPGPDAPPVAGAAHEAVLYQCYNAVVSTNCAVSYDNGHSWPNVQPVADGFTGNCGGINGFGEGGPSGVAAVPIMSGCEKATVAVTTDSGVTWELRKVPNATGVEVFDPEVDFDDDGNMYLIWRGSDEHTYLARSPDHGESWVGPWDVTPPAVQSTIFVSLSVTDDGALGMSFLGTEDTDAGPNDAPENATWNLYQVTSPDGTLDEPTFTSHQVTPEEDPVQVGRICTGGFGGCPDGKRNLLEFIDTAIHPDGRLFTIYTEGCVDACTEDPSGEASTSREIAWARLDGLSLTDPVTVDEPADADEGLSLPGLR